MQLGCAPCPDVRCSCRVCHPSLHAGACRVGRLAASGSAVLCAALWWSGSRCSTCAALARPGRSTSSPYTRAADQEVETVYQVGGLYATRPGQERTPPEMQGQWWWHPARCGLLVMRELPCLSLSLLCRLQRCAGDGTRGAHSVQVQVCRCVMTCEGKGEGLWSHLQAQGMALASR